MTDFIVHVGDGKCGSTAIQAALHHARDRLDGAGVVYETTTPRSGHFNLVRLLGRATRGDDESQLRSAEQTLAALRARLAAGSNRDGVRTVLLSAESFFTVPPDDLRPLLTSIADEIGRVSIVAYVRTPSSMYLSLIQQQLKGSSTFTPPDQYCRRVDRVLERWASAPWVATVVVRLFDRARLVDGDVASDVESVVRRLVDAGPLDLPRVTRNETLSAEQLVVLQRFRRSFLADVEGKLHPTSSALVACFEQLGRAGCGGTKPVLSPRIRDVVTHNNREVVAALNASFPDLQMVEDEPQGAPPGTDGPVVDIGAVLESFDAVLVDDLMALIPAFRPGLERGEIEEAATALDHLTVACGAAERVAAVDAVTRYWRDVGAVGAAEAFEAAMSS